MENPASFWTVGCQKVIQGCISLGRGTRGGIRPDAQKKITFATVTRLPWSSGFGRLSATGARVRILRRKTSGCRGLVTTPTAGTRGGIRTPGLLVRSQTL